MKKITKARKPEPEKHEKKHFLDGKRRLAGILGAIFLAVTLVTGSTFAWFLATDTITNELRSRPVGNVVIAELFVEPHKWIPGQAVIKEVGVLNLSVHDVLVRVSFEELLNKYGDVMQTASRPWTGSEIPVEFDNTKYNTSDGWALPGNLGMTVAPATLTALQGATLMVKEMPITTVAPVGENPSTGYQFALWYTGPGGKIQAVSADLYLEDQPVPTIKISGTPNFYYYPARVTTSTAWTPLLKPQLLSYTKPVAHPATANIDHSALDPAILFGFGQLTAAPTPNNWFYNEEDGYFYYIGKLAPNASTPLLLETVTLSAAADNSHEELKYSLMVNSEAIQNYESAIRATNGWNLDSTGPGPKTQLVITALRAMGVFAD